jgi:hypothetical protein
MAQDYMARKAAKKRAKEARAADSQSAVSRQRKKRVIPKKRQGVCFGQPVISAADLYDSGDEAALDPSAYDILAGAALGVLTFGVLTGALQCGLADTLQCG